MFKARGMYHPEQEHDACGVGFIASINGSKSHDIVEKGVEILCNLEHRGAVGGDQQTGDGVGMLIQLPHEFLRKNAGVKLPDAGSYGAGIIFLPMDKAKQSMSIEFTEQACADECWVFLGWRDVP
ncbi:MAG: hypothetical protein AB2792_22650, partial [Candidatus Thiodiazotropha sp.]